MVTEVIGHRMGLVARISEVMSGVAILMMVIIVASEVIARNLFGFSFQISDEYGGYLIAIVSVLSLSSCQERHAFHRVEIVQSRLGPRARAATRSFFDLTAIGLALVMAWQFLRLSVQSWYSGDVAPTLIQTPYWIPQMFMPLGAFALLISLVGSCFRHIRVALGQKEE